MNAITTSRARIGRGFLTFLAVAGTLASVGAATPPAPGVSYKLRIVITPPDMPGMGSQGPMTITGHGIAVGNRSRIDLDTVPAQLQAAGAMSNGDYMLTLDSGRTVVVTPSAKTYSEGIPGMNSLPPDLLNSAVLSNISVNVEDLGAGEAMQGFPTKHYRITTQYSMAIMGQSMNTSTVQEVWTAKLGTALANAFDGQMPKSMADGPMKELFEKQSAARKQLDGATIKSTTTSSIAVSGMNMSTLQTLEMLEIKQGDVDESLLAIPAGFTKKP
jgi:hypothetical protein